MFSRSAQFDKLLDKATSNLRLDTDWPTIIQICDLIRQNDCSPKYAVSAIKKKLYSQNPHQAMFALIVLESIVKNCGSSVHDEIASKANCEMLRDLVKSTQHENLRNKTLELIQAWAFAFRNNPKYRAVQDTMNIMKAEGYKFPPLKESDAMFSADTAPEWSDGDVCHRCRTAFSLMVRKHHCRACGQVFCQQCSSNTSTIPKFGIEKEVRVCDACYDKVSRPPSGAPTKLDPVDTSSDYGPAQPQKRSGGKTAEELQEEEELQLALALSQSEAEQKEKESKRPSTAHVGLRQNLSASPPSARASPERHATDGSELSRYLDRTHWEQRREAQQSQHQPQPATDVHKVMSYNVVSKSASEQENGAEDAELEEFVSALKSQIEIFVNRMKSDSSRGRSIANDTSVQTLFMNITAMHSRLLRYIQQQDDKRVHVESLQDKVTQTRDSRAALDTLRAEHAARLAAAAEAAERQRQLQMAHKLHMMRKKKHEYLQYQRQLALQRVQEQEREMQMRQEQQKQQYLMAGSGYFMQPQVNYQHPFQPQQVFPNPQFQEQGQPNQQVMMNQAMQRPNNPQGGQLPQMMMPQMRMPMTMHGVAANAPNGPPQSPANPNLSKQGPQMNQQMQMGQVMGPGGMMMNVPMGVVRPGIQQMQMQQQLGPQGQSAPPGHIMMQMQPGAPPMPGQGPQQAHQMHPQNQQVPLQGQPMTSQGQQMPGQGQPMPSQGQHMPSQGQQMPPQSQQISQQGQQMPQSQHLPQQLPPQGQPMPPQGQQMPPQGQPLPQGQRLPQQGQMHQQAQHMQPQGQNVPQMPAQGQQMGHSIPNQQQIPGQVGPQQGQNAPLAPPNFGVQAPPNPHQAPPQIHQPQPPNHQAPQNHAQPLQNQQAPQNHAQGPSQAPASAPAAIPQKSENPTAELISFD